MVDFKTRAPSAQQVHRPEEATEKDKEKTGTRAVPETTTAANEEIIKNAITVAWKTTSFTAAAPKGATNEWKRNEQSWEREGRKTTARWQPTS